jgi:hypothetical protein
MNKTLGKTLVGIAGCLLVAFATWVTKSFWCVIGLYFVCLLIEDIN